MIEMIRFDDDGSRWVRTPLDRGACAICQHEHGDHYVSFDGEYEACLTCDEDVKSGGCDGYSEA